MTKKKPYLLTSCFHSAWEQEIIWVYYLASCKRKDGRPCVFVCSGGSLVTQNSFPLAVLGTAMSVFSAAGAWLQISLSLADLSRTRLNPLLSQGLSPRLCCYSCLFFLRGEMGTGFFFFFPFSQVLSFPKEVCHQALLRSALLNGPNTSKHYSPSPHGGPSPAVLKVSELPLWSQTQLWTSLLLC